MRYWAFFTLAADGPDEVGSGWIRAESEGDVRELLVGLEFGAIEIPDDSGFPEDATAALNWETRPSYSSTF